MTRAKALFAIFPFLMACAPRPAIELRPKGDPKGLDAPPQSDAVLVSPSSRGREVVVDAKAPRTPIGRVRVGDRVRISVIEGSWTNDPGAPLVGAEGAKELCSSFGAHQCIGGHRVSPMMGLMLLRETRAEPVVAEPSCPIGERMYAPTGLEMAVPDDVDLFLGPNDREGELADNVGSLSVEVEVSESKESKKPISKETIEVPAQAARTLAAHVRRGQYVRITPKKGKWIHESKLSPVDAEGVKAERCVDGNGRCLAGSGVAPRMGLMVLIARCGAPVPRSTTNVLREHIPWGTNFVAAEDAELFLAPNDWEDGLLNNAGEVRVRVEIDAQRDR